MPKGEILPIERILFREEEIRDRVAELGQQISCDYAGKELYLVGILKGASRFFIDLTSKINGNILQVWDFIPAGSYGSKTESSGKVEVASGLKADIRRKDVLIVEDIYDTGKTLDFIIKTQISPKKPRSVKVAVLLNKPSRRNPELAGFNPDYVGFEIENYFVVGYGLDYNQRYRNLPFIAALNQDELQKAK